MAVKVMRAAELYNRKFYIMYDLSGWTTMQQDIKTDWTNVMLSQLQITNSPAYALQNGKPVVGIWGMGFNDANHPWDTNACLDVITWFKNQGCYVMGGVPTWWRTGVSDSRNNFLSAYSAFDMISPWMVGRIGNISGADSFYSNPELGDQAYCNSHGIDYQPCVLPGDTGQRAHGDFMWRQFYNMTRLGCQGIYISMFDEFNEGNQIACTAENSSMIPVGSCALYFTLDQDGTSCSSDYYLRLSGDGGKMFKGQIALTTVRPTLPRVPATLPPPPTNLVAQAGNAKVSLTWAAAAGAERYAVKRSIAGIGQFTTLSTNVGLLSFTDSGLVNGTIYFYAVSAASGVGESTNSLPVGAIPYSTAASASSDNPPNETAAKAFDGLTSTKWFNAGAGTTVWLRYYIGGPPMTVVRYDLTSANDVPGRDPKNWQFQGSQDGNAWTTLDTRAGETFPSRYQTKQYSISNSTAYAYYRLNITGNNGDASGLQLAEMAFTFGPATPASLIPIQLGASKQNGQLLLTWPADHLGWRLQTQTSFSNKGIGTNWTTVAGSTVTNQVLLPLSTAGGVFFRLVYP
jgi:hypothetical protein